MAGFVRPALPQELDEAGRITLVGYDADGFLRRADGTFDVEYAAALADAPARARDAEVLVAVHDGALYGTVTWCGPQSGLRQLAKRPDQGEFRMLAVDPERRNRGAGRALVRGCIDRARSQSMTEILMCSLEQMKAAHALYESFGFVRAPSLDRNPAPGVRLLGFRLLL